MKSTDMIARITAESNVLGAAMEDAAPLLLSDAVVCDEADADAVPVADVVVDDVFCCGMFQCTRIMSDARSAKP